MKRRNIINLTLISVIALVGIIIMQALWINMTLKITKIQAFQQTIQIINQSLPQITSKINNQSTTEAQEFTEHLINNSLFEQDLPVKHSVFITTKDNIIQGQQRGFWLVKTISVNTIDYAIMTKCVPMSWLKSGQLLFWVIISILLIIVVAFSVVISLLEHRKNKKLEDIKKDFVSNMTHELKTPIATINVASKMLSSKLLESNDIEKIRRYSKIIHDENMRLQRLVDKVLILSIFDQSQKVYQKIPHNLVEIVKESFQHVELLVEDLHGIIALDIPEFQVIANVDRTHIKNVVVNLLENAIKYSESPPEILLELKVDKKNNQAIISVSDSGPGISDEDKVQIFDRFKRLNKPNGKRVNGLGVGLNYVKSVIEAHEGRVQVSDNQPSGAVFSIFLPCNILL
ncbi:MAG: GHKL domain-containing protein [Bacteroidales bacterium]|nr:GHKL domain-containing protein [Bacteroidales bacterium]